MRFDCPRTCPAYGDRWCRFRPITDTIGPVKVDSHTATVKTEYDYGTPEALRRAVENLGGLWHGHAEHDLGDTKQIGYGFRLQMANGYHKHDGKNYWYHPIVLRADQELAYDEYGGNYGDLTTLEKLKAEYTIAKAQIAAEAIGWQYTREADVLTIYHPNGGTLTITAAGQLDAAGFQGSGCHAAVAELGLPTDNVQLKAEASNATATISLTTV